MTWNYNSEDHSDRYYVTNSTAVQQQLEDLGLAGEHNINNRQDHGMINIEELLNNWLRKVV